MRNLRLLALLPLALALFANAAAEFDGPAPLSWRWTPVSAKVAPSGKPLVVDGTIYISVGDRVYALDQSTGNEKWKFPTTQDVEGGYFRKSPVMAGGILVITNDTMLYGLDPATGKQVWSYKLVDPTQSILGGAVSTGKFVVCALNGEYLLAINGADGKEIWPAQQHVFDRLKGGMVTSGDTLFYFTQTNALCSLNVNAPAKVKTLGQFSTLSEDAVPVLRGGILYINTGSYLAAFNATSGSLRWQIDTQEDLVYGPAVSAEGEAVVSRDGILTIADPYGHIKTMRTPDGKKSMQMKVDLQSGASAEPGAAGAFFVVPTLNGVLNLVDPKDGEIVWRYMVHPMSEEAAARLRAAGKAGQIAGSNGVSRPDPANYSIEAAGPPVVVGDTLLLLAADGSLLSFDKTTGVDVTGPDVRMVSPLAGSEVSSHDLAVAFRISDDASGVKETTITLTANGKPVDHEYTADGLDIVRFSLHGANDLLPDGRVEFVLTVSDWLGNTTTAHFSLSIDNSLQPVYSQLPKGTPSAAGGKGGRR